MPSPLQQYFGRFAFTGDSVEVGTTTFAMVSGTFFTDEFCNTIQEYIRNSVGGQGNANVIYHWDTNGCVGIYFNVASNITWQSSLVNSILGFTAPYQSSATKHCSDAQPRYTWRPSRSLSDYPVDVNTWWAERSTTKIYRAPDGTVYSSKGNEIHEGRYAYRALPQLEVINSTSSNLKEAFSCFFHDVIHEGSPVRVKINRDSSTSIEVTGIISPTKESEPGSVRDYISPSNPIWRTYWDVFFSIWKNA